MTLLSASPLVSAEPFSDAALARPARRRRRGGPRRPPRHRRLRPVRQPGLRGERAGPAGGRRPGHRAAAAVLQRAPRRGVRLRGLHQRLRGRPGDARRVHRRARRRRRDLHAEHHRRAQPARGRRARARRAPGHRAPREPAALAGGCGPRARASAGRRGAGDPAGDPAGGPRRAGADAGRAARRHRRVQRDGRVPAARRAREPRARPRRADRRRRRAARPAPARRPRRVRHRLPRVLRAQDLRAVRRRRARRPRATGWTPPRRTWPAAARSARSRLGATDWAAAPARHEGGTPNVLGAVALAAACRFIDSLPAGAVEAHEGFLTDRLVSGLAAIDGVRPLRLWPVDVRPDRPRSNWRCHLHRRRVARAARRPVPVGRARHRRPRRTILRPPAAGQAHLRQRCS